MSNAFAQGASAEMRERLDLNVPPDWADAAARIARKDVRRAVVLGAADVERARSAGFSSQRRLRTAGQPLFSTPMSVKRRSAAMLEIFTPVTDDDRRQVTPGSVHLAEDFSEASFRQDEQR
jgi:hypothetical protein